ncbi:F-box domain-containing protein [Favolaschia claudopus]|uniref:F-box domain-containing protein n=1 Tax=Favolaschia claudopus TaxID=2862362 RepID=A0AAW0CT21_9AGAR
MPFPPSELQKEIAALSSEIEAQKAILDDLIGRRNRAQRNLNAVLDPMARLPLELQSKIFVHCLCFDEDEGASRPDPKLAPMLVFNVCQLWRDIALSTPELWSHLRMEGSPRGSNHFQLYEIWLERSRSLPVSLTLEGTSVLAADVNYLIDCSAQRVEELSLLLLADPHDEYRIPQLPF